ncbi:response regulator transcription factor [Natronoglycomyces albus]|uniref:Response regulator transcription factor n=1 Tax=Natronoglycomyces albus TaxID=2811108 RepID=A0A895XRK7_9ACTN|nr:response regulator transcription factor [Natronoglycomyces albus]QSB06342.1 response regulator transcription factor [Natronoglycomyces albus]
MTLRVAIVDDEDLIRTGFSAIISAEEDMEVVAEAADGVGAVNIARSGAADVILMDVRMPKVNGIAATRQILEGAGTHLTVPKILIVTTFENDDYVYQALQAGADGFLLKRTRADDLLAAIRLLARSDSLLFPDKIRRLATSHRGLKPHLLAQAGLSQRESQVLKLMANGLSNDEIARELFLGRETVKSHVGSIYRKLAVRDRTQAVIAAYESGLVGT